MLKRDGKQIVGKPIENLEDLPAPINSNSSSSENSPERLTTDSKENTCDGDLADSTERRRIFEECSIVRSNPSLKCHQIHGRRASYVTDKTNTIPRTRFGHLCHERCAGSGHQAHRRLQIQQRAQSLPEIVHVVHKSSNAGNGCLPSSFFRSRHGVCTI